jgi:hypothetical protein
MALEKVTVVDSIEVVESSVVQIRTKTSIMEDGEQISATYHRHSVAPGDDYSKEDARVQAICAATHTPEVISAYTTSVSAKGA